MAIEKAPQAFENADKKTNIFVLPLFESALENDLRILILTDGNNRASFENKNYDDGGQNVIRIAEELAKRGDVSMMVACILGPDNVKKRPPGFKRKIIGAFDMLSRRIDSRGLLVKSEIRLEPYGNLQEMAMLSPVDEELARTINEACQKTAHIQKPALRLLLGVNYDEDIAIDLGVNIIYRSGMEKPDNFRTSGIRVHEGIRNYGSTTLWPDVQAEEIHTAIEDVRSKLQKQFRLGYSSQKILEILEAVNLENVNKNGTHSITIPYHSSSKDMDSILNEFFRTKRSLRNILVELYDRNGEKRKNFGNVKSELTIRLVHGASLSENNDGTEDNPKTYTAFVAPGQSINGVTIPIRPKIDYANVHTCPESSAEIIMGIRKAVDFAMGTTQLLGAERELKIEDLPEFERYFTLRKKLKGQKGKSLDEIEKSMEEEHRVKNTDEDHYNRMADLFAAQILDWSENAKIKWPSSPAFRAFINYAFTSFFFAYFPNHPEWKNGLEKNWLKKAEVLAKYMILTYAMDDFIYDTELPENEKKDFIATATELLVASVHRHPEHHRHAEFPSNKEKGGKTKATSGVRPAIPKILSTLTDEFAKLSAELEQMADEDSFNSWKKSMTGIMECMYNEWQNEVLSNPLLKRVGVELDEKFDAKYLNDSIPPTVRELIRQSRANYESADDIQKRNHFYDLKLYTYLVDIEKSIGSGNIYKTMACIDSKDTPLSQEASKDLDTICALINYYFRIANDLAEYSRAPEDRDSKISAVQILSAKYNSKKNPEQSESLGYKQLRELMLSLRESLYGSITEFQKRHRTSPIELGIGVALQRARIGELFYNGTHYREAKRPMVKNFFQQLQNCGINAA